MALIGQEMSADPWIDVPGEVLDVLRLWRPTPLRRAARLEAALGTPARIYYKDESVSPAGSHKPNTAVPQAFYNKAEGINRSPPRPAPGSGGAHCRSRARCSTWSATSTWCGRRSIRSRTAA
jgi:tryptophan synthase beta chain